MCVSFMQVAIVGAFNKVKRTSIYEIRIVRLVRLIVRLKLSSFPLHTYIGIDIHQNTTNTFFIWDKIRFRKFTSAEYNE